MFTYFFINHSTSTIHKFWLQLPSSKLARRKCPKWLVAMVTSSPSDVSVFTLLPAIPAFSTNTSILDGHI